MVQEYNRTADWIVIFSEVDRRAQTPHIVIATGYDYGFVPVMGRLISAHKEIGPAFGQLFRTIMFGPGHLSRQKERW